jgi:hypothetical protein
VDFQRFFGKKAPKNGLSQNPSGVLGAYHFALKRGKINNPFWAAFS